MSRLKIYLILTVLFFFIACAGKFQYFPPVKLPLTQNSITINMNKEDLWKKIIPALGKSFFVINNLDKNSGFINLSYSGDPEKYVDCGRIYSYVRNVQGERIYDFPAAKAHQKYEIMDMEHGGILSSYDRKMELEGRINIVIEEISPKASQITVNVKYILTKSIKGKNAQGRYGYVSHSITFNSGQQEKFPGLDDFVGTFCQPTYQLEKMILSLFSQ